MTAKAEEEREELAGLAGQHAAQRLARVDALHDLGQRQHEQGDGDGDDGVEEGDEPVEPTFGAHPRRLGSHLARCQSAGPLASVMCAVCVPPEVSVQVTGTVSPGS
jgi:hypothetical protein